MAATQLLHIDLEAVSGICGSISIACWVVVFSPQIIQNFRRGSADALSVQFIIVWLIGDVFNILGAVLQGVLPTMVVLAIYYAIADIVLLGQCFYYSGFTWLDTGTSTLSKPVLEDSMTRADLITNNLANERTSLLPTSDVESMGPSQLAPPDWTHLSPAVPLVTEDDLLDGAAVLAPGAAAVESQSAKALQAAAWNLAAMLMVCAVGILGWALGRLSRRSGYGNDDYDRELGELDLLGQVFGYLSAVAYIGSRIPQLMLNWRRQSTDGLSILFFLFACLGNITYVLSIMVYEPRCGHGRDGRGRCAPGEVSRQYAHFVLVNLSWLLGSIVTLLLDFVVLAQYFKYSSARGAGRLPLPKLMVEADDSTTDEEQATDRTEQVRRGRERNRRHPSESWDQRPLLNRGDSTI